MNKFLIKGEDEDNEFIPLFSFNEQDVENEPEIEIDSLIPILPLRNTVLFPGVVIPITVGRDKSVLAVKAAFNKDKFIGVVSQKDGNIEDPAPADLCKIGTVAKIVKMIKMQDGGTTIIIQGKKRYVGNLYEKNINYSYSTFKFVIRTGTTKFRQGNLRENSSVSNTTE